MITAETFQKVFNEGSSSPALVTGSDGLTYVLKFVGSGPGPTGLLSEYLVNRVAAEAWKFPVPTVRIMEVRKGRPPGIGTDEFWDLVARSVGPNLALEYIPNTKAVTDCAPLRKDPETMARLHFMDCVFANFDRTPKNPNLLIDPKKKITFIDHDSCRFLFDPPVALAPGHLLAAEIIDPSFLEGLTEPTFQLCDKICRDIPSLWRVTRVNPIQLHGILRKRIQEYHSQSDALPG